jgi:uncharacterized protein YegP (UPF0339 family)
MIELDDAIKEMEKINAGYYQIEFNYKNHRVAITIERIEDEDDDENA